MKHLSASLLLCLLLSGCVTPPPERFFAVSSSGDPKLGGIYSFVEGDAHYFRPLPTTSYMITSPDGRYFYCAVSKLYKNDGGGILVMMQQPNHAFVPVGAFEAGKGPCHLVRAESGKFLYVANYSDGTVSELWLNKGNPFRKRDIRLTGTADPKSKRQNAPHPHYVGFDTASENLFVVDLGLNEIWRYPFSNDNGIPEQPAEKISVHKGAGPRHLVFSPDGQFFYSANELDSTLSVFQNFGGNWKETMSIPTRKSTEKNPNYPGTIRSTKDGRFLFLTNRGDNDIVLFEVLKDKRVVKLANVSCGLFPNDLELTPDEQYLAVSNFFGGTVEFFRFDRKEKKLTPETKSYPVPGAVKVIFPVESTEKKQR